MLPPPEYEVKRRLKHVGIEGVIHWLDSLQSSEEVLEKDEASMATANTDVSYDADGRRRFRHHRPRVQTNPALWDLASGAWVTQC